MKAGMIVLVTLILSTAAVGQEPTGVITPIANNVSFYKNVDDLGRSRGTTLQIVLINSVRIVTDFTVEITGDLNWDLDWYEDHDYYVELSLVKPIYKSLSVNYQRIYGTFVDKPINQFGVRLSLFTGS
jgi:hypothetical protein